MKRIIAYAMSGAAALLCGCSGVSVTQEMKENASFEGLTKIYIEEPAGAAEIFSANGSLERANEELVGAIAANLAEKGFARVDNKADAQIIFRPLWNASYRQPEFDAVGAAPRSAGIGDGVSSKLYAMLEIQAILPESGDIWSWRGFSPELISPAGFTSGNIAEQVRWCLEYFPPEKNPDKLGEIKKERREREIKAEQNPYKDVLIKEREKRESL
ncbi:MAG: hypothetical protein IJI37_02055 [Opitutales bacterium]|nr:hypothetical protein [Opitutales bacterium]